MLYGVTHIRTFKSTGTELGAAISNGSWFVVMRRIGEKEWSTHCGPYSTFDQAEGWINDIRET